MIGGVASSCRPPRDCSRRNRKRSQRNNGDRNTGARDLRRCRPFLGCDALELHRRDSPFQVALAVGAAEDRDAVEGVLLKPFQPEIEALEAAANSTLASSRLIDYPPDQHVD